MVDSLHVPASVVQRAVTAIKWLTPYVTGALIAGLGFSAKWLESRVSRVELGNAVGAVKTVATAAQATAYHGASLADAHAIQLAQLWSHVVAMQAELLVSREYATAPPTRRAKLIEDARRYYAHEYQLQLTTHATDPAEAARLALLAPWRP